MCGFCEGDMKLGGGVDSVVSIRGNRTETEMAGCMRGGRLDLV